MPNKTFKLPEKSVMLERLLNANIPPGFRPGFRAFFYPSLLEHAEEEPSVTEIVSIFKQALISKPMPGFINEYLTSKFVYIIIDELIDEKKVAEEVKELLRQAPATQKATA